MTRRPPPPTPAINAMVFASTVRGERVDRPSVPSPGRVMLLISGESDDELVVVSDSTHDKDKPDHGLRVSTHCLLLLFRYWLLS